MKHNQGSFRGNGEHELFYQSWAPDDQARASLGIVHGFAEHSGRYSNVVEYFVPRTFKVYGFDLRGHGRSGGRKNFIQSWDDYRGDVKAFIDLIRKEEVGSPIFLYGHSMGGTIVLDYVLLNPADVIGVIASAPAIGEIGIPAYLWTIARLLNRVWPTFAMESQLDPAYLSREPSVAQAYEDDPLVNTIGTTRLGVEIGEAGDRIQERASDLKIPLLIVPGGSDQLVEVEGSQRFFGNVGFEDKELKIYEGAYHELHNDIIKEQVFEDIKDWIERHI
jgi:alpha-beta hydrolase superfamily lysophospholipase